MGKQAPHSSVRKPERLGNWTRLTQLSIREEASARAVPINQSHGLQHLDRHQALGSQRSENSRKLSRSGHWRERIWIKVPPSTEAFQDSCAGVVTSHAIMCGWLANVYLGRWMAARASCNVLGPGMARPAGSPSPTVTTLILSTCGHLIHQTISSVAQESTPSHPLTVPCHLCSHSNSLAFTFPSPRPKSS